MTNYSVRLRKGDREFELAGDKDFIESFLTRLKSGEFGSGWPGQEASDGKGVVFETGGGKSASLVELLQKVGATTHPMKILAMGYYLEKGKGQESFSKADIVRAYNEAKEKYSQIPNVYRDFAKCEKQGWVMKRGGDAKAFVLTSTGERIIKSKLEDNVKG